MRRILLIIFLVIPCHLSGDNKEWHSAKKAYINLVRNNELQGHLYREIMRLERAVEGYPNSADVACESSGHPARRLLASLRDSYEQAISYEKLLREEFLRTKQYYEASSKKRFKLNPRQKDRRL